MTKKDKSVDEHDEPAGGDWSDECLQYEKQMRRDFEKSHHERAADYVTDYFLYDRGSYRGGCDGPVHKLPGLLIEAFLKKNPSPSLKQLGEFMLDAGQRYMLERTNNIHLHESWEHGSSRQDVSDYEIMQALAKHHNRIPDTAESFGKTTRWLYKRIKIMKDREL